MTQGPPAPMAPVPTVWSRLAYTLPARLRTRLQPAAALPWGARAAFVARWLSGAPERRPRFAAGRPRRVVFVCHGNIIRSPLAAALCRREAELLGVALEVSSAGLHAKAGRGADPRASDVAAGLGVSLDGHHAQPLTDAVVRSADLLLVMDFSNDAELVARFPSAWRKVRLLGVFGDGDGALADPFAGDAAAVRVSAGRIQTAVRGLVQLLKEPARL